MSKISHHWNQALLLQLLTAKAASPCQSIFKIIWSQHVRVEPTCAHAGSSLWSPPLQPCSAPSTVWSGRPLGTRSEGTCADQKHLHRPITLRCIWRNFQQLCFKTAWYFWVNRCQVLELPIFPPLILMARRFSVGNEKKCNTCSNEWTTDYKTWIW